MEVGVEVQSPACKRTLVNRRRVGEPSTCSRAQAQVASRDAGSPGSHGGIVGKGVPSVPAAVVDEAAGHQGSLGPNPVPFPRRFQLQDRRRLPRRRRPVADQGDHQLLRAIFLAHHIGDQRSPLHVDHAVSAADEIDPLHLSCGDAAKDLL